MLLAHLLVLALLPLAEAHHHHGHTAGAELHAAGEACGHEAHHSECSLLRIGTAPALAGPTASLAPAPVLVSIAFRPASSVGLPDHPTSPALPRAPPAV